MDVLCDELLHEIIERLPPSSFASISLVSKRWLSALRSSTTSLSLSIPFSAPPLLPFYSLSSILSHYPHLNSLSIHSSPFDDDDDGESYPPSPPPPLPTPTSITPLMVSDALLLAVASSPSSSRLNRLRFATAATPVSPAALLSSSSSLIRLTHLHLSSVFPYSFRWLAGFPFIKSLSLVFCPKSPAALDPLDEETQLGIGGIGVAEDDDGRPMKMLPLETLSLSGLRAGDRAMSWIWRRCGNLRLLRFRACESTGDCPSSSSFPSCLPGLLELELRSCRAIADRVLLHAADHCRRLNSLLLHDGGSSDALHHFITQCAAGLRTIDLRLPLDLHNYHLSAIAAAASHSSRLSTLRLQSCCLVTGDGLRSAVGAAGNTIEELALVNCDVVEREPGLLSILGQSLPRLQKLDLSFNETMTDKEMASMLSSCSGLIEIKLQGCGKLTDAALVWLLAYCRSLEVADLNRCPGISPSAIETLVINSCRLRLVCVEKKKVSEAAMAMASRRGIWIGD